MSKLHALTVGLLGMSVGIAVCTHAQQLDTEINPHPLFQYADGSSTAIENFLVDKQEWWSSFRVAFTSNQYTLAQIMLGPLHSRFSKTPRYFESEVNITLESWHGVGYHPTASARGLGGFPCNDLYFAAGNHVLHVTPDDTHGPAFTIFSQVDGLIRSVLFDTVGTFGYDMLAATEGGSVEGGSVFRINKLGKATRLAVLNDGVAGIDIVPKDSRYGPPAGQLIALTETLGHIQAIDGHGNVTDIRTNRDFSGAQALYVLPRPSEDAPLLLHWPFYLERPYSKQILGVDAFAVVLVQNRGRRELLALQLKGSNLTVGTLFDLSKVDEVTFLSPTHLPAGSACPAQP